MNDLILQEIDRIANKIYHFRMIFDIDGSAENDKGIAEDFWHQGIRRNHRIFHELQHMFHDELQGTCLQEYKDAA